MEPKGLYWALEIEPITEFPCACRQPSLSHDNLGIAAKLDDSRFVSVRVSARTSRMARAILPKPLCFLTIVQIPSGEIPPPKTRAKFFS